MHFQLLAHQSEGVSFLTEKRRGLLAFEQGLGKTLVAIEAFQRLRLDGLAGRMLVICPNSLKRNWVAEIEKFAPDVTVAIAEGPPKTRRSTLADPKAEVVVISYETARTEVTALLSLVQRQRTALVLDESHAAKNWKSLTSTAVREVSPHCTYRWLLSGTPVTNSPADIFTQIEILAPGERVLGSMESFLATVEANPSDSGVRDALDGVVLRRTKEECLDLPEKSFSDVLVELPAWQRRLYDDMREEMVCEIRAMSGEQYRAFASTALAQLTRLSQLASNPGLLFPDIGKSPAKFDALDGLLSDILTVEGRKVIVWSNYVRTIEDLLERLSEYGTEAIYGGTPTNERQDIAARFQEGSETRVLLANPAAAGTGFTLTAASYTIYESLSWRYDHYAQSQDRNHRIGQSMPVTYLRLLAADTIEEAVVRALARKSSLASSLLGDADLNQVVGNLSKDEMCALIETNSLPEYAA